MRKIIGALLLVGILLTMAFIWRQSAATAEESSEDSGRVTEQVARVTVSDFESKPEPEKQTILDRLHPVVRSWAHALEFCLLSCLVACFCFVALRCPLWLAPVCAVAFSFLWALCDEWHQIRVPGRAFEWADVGVDTLGAAAGAAFAVLVCWLCSYAARRRAAKDGRKAG